MMAAFIGVQTDSEEYYLKWEMNEDFSDLIEMMYTASDMTAEHIMSMKLPEKAKILLSGIAGAVMQSVIDRHEASNKTSSMVPWDHVEFWVENR